MKDALEPNPTTKIDQNALGEFTTPAVVSMGFPTLFPDGAGEPTNRSTISSISDSDREIFAAKLKHLVKLAEKMEGKWFYRFAFHPRLGCWVHNILYRKRLLSQGNFYMN